MMYDRIKGTEYNSITEIPDEVLDGLDKEDLLTLIRHFRTRHQTNPKTLKPIIVTKKIIVEIPRKEANNSC